MRRAIRVVLNPDENEVLPASNYAIYSACHTIVSIVKKGEGLFDALQMEMERCVGSLVRSCVESDKEKIEWLGFFVTTCKWFETKIVRVLVLYVVDLEWFTTLPPLESPCFVTHVFGPRIYRKKH